MALDFVSLCREIARGQRFLEIVDHPAGWTRLAGIPETRFHFKTEVLRFGRVGKTCTILCATQHTKRRAQKASFYNILKGLGSNDGVVSGQLSALSQRLGCHILFAFLWRQGGTFRTGCPRSRVFRDLGKPRMGSNMLSARVTCAELTLRSSNPRGGAAARARDSSTARSSTSKRSAPFSWRHDALPRWLPAHSKSVRP
jgi:hypothetical protein